MQRATKPQYESDGCLISGGYFLPVSPADRSFDHKEKASATLHKVWEN